MKEIIRMAKAFGEESGQAKKSELEYIKFEFGENKMRMVGVYYHVMRIGSNYVITASQLNVYLLIEIKSVLLTLRKIGLNIISQQKLMVKI